MLKFQLMMLKTQERPVLESLQPDGAGTPGPPAARSRPRRIVPGRIPPAGARRCGFGLAVRPYLQRGSPCLMTGSSHNSDVNGPTTGDRFDAIHMSIAVSK